MNFPAKFVTMDAGLRCCGLSVWHDGRLRGAVLARNPLTRERGLVAWHAMSRAAVKALAPFVVGPLEEYAFIGEQMVARRQQGNYNDLLEVNGVLAAVGGLFNEAKSYIPETWKGTIDGDVMVRRIPKKLDPYEAVILDAVECPASLKHNVIDAVGLGLFVCGRLKGEPR